MDKIIEMFMDKLDKKLSTKAFVIIVGFITIIFVDYDNKILWNSISTIKVLLISAALIALFYNLIIKRKVKKFISGHDAREFKDDKYIIECGKLEIDIYHNKQCVLWGGKPNIKVRVQNKSNESIDNFCGFVDLYNRDTCIIHEKIERDYILPELAYEEKMLEGEEAFCNWETAKFICIENNERKVYSGPLRYGIPDIDYWLIGNKTWHVMKQSLERPISWIEWVWKGGSYRIQTKKDYVIRKMKTYLYRMIIGICGLILFILGIVWIFFIYREFYYWVMLHIDKFM